MQKLLDDIRMEMDTLKGCIGRMEQRLDELQGKFAELNNLLQAGTKAQASGRVVEAAGTETSVAPAARKEDKEDKEEEKGENPSASLHNISEETPASSILGERIRPAADLRHAISLNDSFRFTRELFGGDAARMNRIFDELGGAGSFEAAMSLLQSEVQVDGDNEAAAALVELLHKYFN